MMDMDREHLVEPARHRERGLTLWVGLVLGFAGIIVTVGGIYEWNQRKTGARSPKLNTEVVVATPAPANDAPGSAARELIEIDPEILELRQQLADERQARIQAESRAFQREQEEARRRPRRCIDGVSFEQFDQEWRNVGRC